MSYRKILTVCLTAILSFAYSPVSADTKRITAYTTLDEPTARAVFQQFKKDTGIEVKFVRLSTGETVARLEAERKNPQVGIWFGGVGIGHIRAKNKGLTMPYRSPAAANLPPKFKDKDFYWTGIYAGPLTFESNIKNLKKYKLPQPQSWQDLTKPIYKGHIQMANPGSSGTAYNVLATVVQVFGEEKAFDFMQKLDSNITMYTRSGSAPGKHAAIGEVSIAIGYAHDGVKLISNGFPLSLSFPKEGTGFEVAAVSLVKGGPKEELENAKKLLDWGLGESAAKIYAQKSFAVPFVNVPLPAGSIPIARVNTIDQDDEWAAKNKARLIEKWNAVISEGESKTVAKKKK